MTFGDLFEYKVSLLFSAWNIETRGDFAIAWFGVTVIILIIIRSTSTFTP